MATRKQSAKRTAKKTAKKGTGAKKAAKKRPVSTKAPAKKKVTRKKKAGQSQPRKGAAKKPAAKKKAAAPSRSRKSPRVRPAAPLMAAALAPAAPHFPGFDTGSYPGDQIMEKWFGSPYVFTGFYLEAPCHKAPKFRPWSGHRETLKQIGWGFVVVYVGRQAAGCGANMLTRAQGLADAADAVSKALGEGFHSGVTIFLDVELMDTLSNAMVEYMRGWIAGILQDGTYKPGIYSHFRNATDLFNAAQQEYAAQGQAGGAPAFWVVRVPGGTVFNVNQSSPKDLNNFSTRPISFASVWQGKIDIASETHAGVKFGPVDQDVADTNNPSNA